MISKLNFIFVFSLLINFSISQPVVDWQLLMTTFEQYLEYPSGFNARKVSDLLPDSGHTIYSKTDIEKRAKDLIYKNLNMLERQVISKDKEAANLAFKMITISDGDFTETLHIMLGKLIRIDPKLFLEQLRKNRKIIKDLGPLLNNQGNEYVDRIEGQILECNLRIKSLQGISEPNLLKVRNDCLDELESHKAFIEDIKQKIQNLNTHN